MKKYWIVLLSVIMMFAFTATAFAFTDTTNLPANSQSAIEKLTNLKIIQGYEDGTFQPAANITRGEFAKIAVLTAKEKGYNQMVPATPSFGDVKTTDWYYQWVTDAAKLGLMKGVGNNAFAPNDPITQAEVLTVMVRLLGYQDADLTGAWPQNYLTKANALGLNNGVTVNGSANATRETVALFTAKTLDTKAKEEPAETSGINYGIIESINKNTYTIYDLAKGNVSYQIAGNADITLKKEERQRGVLVAYTIDADKKITSLNRDNITTNKTLSADIKNGNIKLNGKEYGFANNAKVYQVSGGSGGYTVYPLSIDKVLENSYVSGQKSSDFSFDIQYVLADGKVSYLFIASYSNMAKLKFGFIEDYGYQAAGIDNAVKFYGDPVDYEIKEGGSTPEKNALFAYSTSGNRASLTKVAGAADVEGVIDSVDNDILMVKTADNATKQVILTKDTTVMKVTYKNGNVDDVENAYNGYSTGDKVIARYDVNDPDSHEAAYIIFTEEA